MANQEQVALVLQGEAWRRWREEHVAVTPDLSGADLYETLFVDTSLINALGLDACEHLGPNVLDHRTLALSKRLPLPFLRGCGLPEKFIDYLPSLLDQPIQFYSCFISYSNKDQNLQTGFMLTKTKACAAGSLLTKFRQKEDSRAD